MRASLLLALSALALLALHASASARGQLFNAHLGPGAYAALDRAAEESVILPSPPAPQPPVAAAQLTAQDWLRLQTEQELLVKKTAPAAEAICTAYTRQDNCYGDPSLTPGQVLAPCGPHAGAAPNTTRFAIIGDYGLDGNCERLVHELVTKFGEQFGTLDFVLSTGDNAYWGGSCQSMRESVAAYYGDFFPTTDVNCVDPKKKNQLGGPERVYPAQTRGRWNWQLHKHGAARSDPLPRFFPCLGNHDWNSYRHDWRNLPYFQYFDFLRDFSPQGVGEGSYYTVEPAPGLQLFALNSNLMAPGAPPAENVMHEEQVAWVKAALANSTATFKVVFFHHPPFSTAQHDALAPWVDLPYEEWGAHLVLSGHQHVYERLVGAHTRADGTPGTIPYIINGLGGHPWTYDQQHCPPFRGSQKRYNDFHGAQIAIKSWDEHNKRDRMDVCFYNSEGTMIDHFEL